MSGTKNRLIIEKLGGVSVPDVDRAWTEMEKTLDIARLRPKKSIIARLIKKPIIWLNLLVLSVAAGGAVIVVQKGHDSQSRKEEKLVAGPEVNVNALLAFNALLCNTHDSMTKEAPEEKLPSAYISPPETTFNSETSVVRINEKQRTHILRLSRKGTLGIWGPRFNAPSRIHRNFEEVEYKGYKLLRLQLGAHAGVYPGIQTKDLIGQLGIEAVLLYRANTLHA